jgi:hypothetical protein
LEIRSGFCIDGQSVGLTISMENFSQSVFEKSEETSAYSENRTHDFRGESHLLGHRSPTELLNAGGSSLICKEGCRFSMGWCMREPYCPLSSAVCNATIPTLPLFEIAESPCSPFCFGFLSRMRDWTFEYMAV